MKLTGSDPPAETEKLKPSQASGHPAPPDRIKVLHIINDLSIGGAEMMLYKVLSGTNMERFTPTVITLRNRGKLRERIEGLGVPVYSVARRQEFSPLGSTLRLIRLTRQLKPDVIQGWMYHGNLAAQVASSFAPGKVRVLWNIRQSLYSLDHEKRATAAAIKLGARLSKKPAMIVYNSRTSEAQHEVIGYRSKDNLIIPNGFDTNLFTPSAVVRRSLRAELGVAGNTTLIGLICRYHPMKDHANFLQAAALLLRRHPDVQFVLAGRGACWDTETLRKLIQKLNLVERVHLLGERDDIARVTAALDIATSASFYGEGFPNVIGEAMACGVPCVVTDISDLPWVVGETGLVVPPRDPEAMAGAFGELIELGASGRESMGRAARQRVQENFHIDSVVAQYETLYEGVVSQKEIGRFGTDVRYQRLLEHIPSGARRDDASDGAANVRRARSPRTKR